AVQRNPGRCAPIPAVGPGLLVAEELDRHQPTPDRGSDKRLLSGTSAGVVPARAAAAPARGAQHSRALSGTSRPGGAMAAPITRPRPSDITLQRTVDAFLSSTRCENPNTRRAYAGVLDALLADLGPGRPLADVSGGEIATVLRRRWGGAAPSTWNRNRAAI